MTDLASSLLTRPRRIAAAGAIVVLAIAPAAMASNTQSANQASCTKGATGFAVGDSVLDAVNYTGGKTYLQKFLGGSKAPSDGDVNRQFAEGASLIKGYLAKNPKACAVVVSIGTNGPVRPSDWDGLMKSLSKVPRVVVVNTYTKNYRSEQSWMPQMNSDIAALQKKFRNVRVADWYSVAQTLGSGDLPDGVHPDSLKAAKAWVNTVASALNRR
ncbi:MAG: hypothetical protein KGQ95_05170 [Acidobacteria bacterium]|nr:hypothetical protein [Acidobacteriota bacterium]